MPNYLGQKVKDLRDRLRMTQDQLGARYQVSGPGIFKIEKGYIKPSLELWLKISRDCGMSEREAVLLWVKAKLPDQYHDFIEIIPSSEAAMSEQSARFGELQDLPEYMKIANREDLRQALANDENVPPGLRDLVLDDDFWVVFKPTGSEIHAVVQKFGMFKNGNRETFSEALRLVRAFFSA